MKPSDAVACMTPKRCGGMHSKLLTHARCQHAVGTFVAWCCMRACQNKSGVGGEASVRACEACHPRYLAGVRSCEPLQMCKLLCEMLDKDGVKDIESAVGAVRSDKVKKEREQLAKDKKGAQPTLLRPLRSQCSPLAMHRF
jgi:hypothetical protein